MARPVPRFPQKLLHRHRRHPRSLPQEVRNDELFRRWLNAQGLKLTPHRRAVLGVLRAAHTPLSVEELKKHVPGAHEVTLYRTLDTFARAGVVRAVGFDETRARFELAFDHHHHIVCTSCERIEDVRVPDTTLERQALARSKQFRRVASHSLEFFGLCKQCAR